MMKDNRCSHPNCSNQGHWYNEDGDFWCVECLEGAASDEVFIHITPSDACEHDFQGWREFEDGRGGERVCTKCGMGAMEHSLRCDDWEPA